MGIHSSTIEKLEDNLLCDRVLREISRNYSQRFVQRRYNITRRQLQRIIQLHSDKKQLNKGYLMHN